MNWSHYVLNELLQDAKESQEKGNAFHYSWLLILILFVASAKPTNYQGVDIPVRCRGDRYQNLWFDKYIKGIQRDNNVQLFLHREAPRHHWREKEIIIEEIVQCFKNIIKFISGPHNILMQSQQDPQCQWLATRYLLSEE